MDSTKVKEKYLVKKTKSVENTLTVVPPPCLTCGHVDVPNPLVAQGLITEDLANILVPPKLPDFNGEKKNRRVPGARLLTGRLFRKPYHLCS